MTESCEESTEPIVNSAALEICRRMVGISGIKDFGLVDFAFDENNVIHLLDKNGHTKMALSYETYQRLMNETEHQG